MGQVRRERFQASSNGSDEVSHVLHLPHFALGVGLEDAQAVPELPPIASLLLAITLQHAIMHSGSGRAATLI